MGAQEEKSGREGACVRAGGNGREGAGDGEKSAQLLSPFISFCVCA